MECPMKAKVEELERQLARLEDLVAWTSMALALKLGVTPLCRQCRTEMRLKETRAGDQELVGFVCPKCGRQHLVAKSLVGVLV